ncbi:NACHT and WD repeat domain-containing protein [Streptomyces sp. NPDC058665]|uniref:NACHT and WD repeat domain-containing protein n=1 Tax=Streptomyces sp. NPDC058665 TaxID=3346586 RepID=UPI003652AE93
MSSPTGDDENPGPNASDPPPEGNRLDARASRGATAIVAGRDVYITYTHGTRRRRRSEKGDPSRECPYPGLAAFGADSARWFFGRDQLVAELTTRLDRRLRTGGTQMVVAPSGAGKTSLLRAGLLPRLDRGALPGSAHWPKIVLTPGSEPLHALAAGIASLTGSETGDVAAELVADPRKALAGLSSPERPGDGAVIVVDQFEELFTVCTDERQRRTFIEVLDSLSEVREGRAALVVVGLRADFYTRCVDHPRLRAALEDSPLVVGPMSEAELRQAIVYPAEDVGLEVEAGLEELLLTDLGASWRGGAEGTGGYETGRLPLLAHALRSCWQERTGRVLSVQGYVDTGGIKNAVARTADSVYGALDETDRGLARSLLLRLVNIGDGTEDTRRRVAREELIRATGDGPRAALVLEAFTKARLLTVQLDSVEISHEVLLTSWPLLKGWIDDDRGGRLTLQRLEDAAEAWHEGGHESSLLYGGSRLETAESWAAGARPDEPSTTAREFLAASAHARRRTGRVRAGITATLAVLALLAGVGAVAAFTQQREARGQQQEAERQRDLVLYNQVIATADRLSGTDVSVAAQLDAIAQRMNPGGDSYSRLTTAANGPLSTPFTAHRAAVCALALAPDGRTLVTGSFDNTVRLWDISDMTRPRPRGEPLTGFADGVCALAFSPDGRTLATGSHDSSVRLWDLSESGRPEPLGPPLPGYEQAAGVHTLAFSPDGRVLATGSYPAVRVVGGDPGLRLWDVSNRADPELLGRSAEGAMDVDHLAFTPDGRRLVTSPGGMGFRVWDIADPKRPEILGSAPKGHERMVSALVVSPDGRTVVTGSSDKTLRVWDISKPERIAPRGQPVTDLAHGIESLAFADDGLSVAAASDDASVQLWNLSDPTAPVPLGAPLAGHTGNAGVLVFAPDGRTLIAGDQARTVRMWKLPVHLPIGRTLGRSFPNSVDALAFSPDGRTLASGHFDKSVRLWNVSDRARPVLLSEPRKVHTYTVCALAFSADGKTLASGSRDETVLLWDVSDPKRPRALRKLTGHAAGACALDFSSDGRTLATGTESGSVFLWDVADPAQPSSLGRSLIEVDEAIESLDFSPDARTLAAGAGDARVRLWDVSERSQAAPLGEPLSAHTARVGALSFSPDGHTLATGGTDAVRLWDVSDPAGPGALRTLAIDTNTVGSLIFTPDGKTLMSGARETVQLWDVSVPRKALPRGEPLTGHTGGVKALALSPDGRTLASGGGDQVIKLWELDAGRNVERICAGTRKSPTAEAWSRHISGGIPFPAPC